MMPKNMIVANWKMNGRCNDVKQLLIGLQAGISSLPENTDCVILPPAIFVPMTEHYLQNSPLLWGGQNCYGADYGAYTGEHSALMFKEYGCRYLLVGHSERRRLFKEDEKMIAEKFHLIKYHGMIPILCIGETLEERQEGRTEAVLLEQLKPFFQDTRSFEKAVIAYEPVWAIGTGMSAAPEQAQTVHAFIREQISALHRQDGANVSILYGGSVHAKNAGDLFKMKDINGALVGGASLDLSNFLEIVTCIN